MGFIEESSHPRGVWVLLMRVLIQGVCGFYGCDFSSKGCVGFIEASSHPRGVWVLLMRVLIQGVCGFY